MKLMSSNSHLDTLKIIIDIMHLQHFETGITPKKLAKYNTHYYSVLPRIEKGHGAA